MKRRLLRRGDSQVSCSRTRSYFYRCSSRRSSTVLGLSDWTFRVQARSSPRAAPVRQHSPPLQPRRRERRPHLRSPLSTARRSAGGRSAARAEVGRTSGSQTGTPSDRRVRVEGHRAGAHYHRRNVGGYTCTAGRPRASR